MKLRLLGGYHGACKKWTAGLWLLCLLTWSSRAAVRRFRVTVLVLCEALSQSHFVSPNSGVLLCLPITIQAATNSPTVAPTRVGTRCVTRVISLLRYHADPSTRRNTISQVPTTRPTSRPTVPPTQSPTIAPTRVPTRTPTQVPTQSPTRSPTQSPTISATTFVWKPDSYRVRGKTLPSAPHGSFNLSLSSNRQIVQGAYKIKVGAGRANSWAGLHR